MRPGMARPKGSVRISIAEDFSKYPAGRFREDGPGSGAAFREDHLAPALNDPDVDQVVVSVDGIAGFGTSFLDEAFGGLVRESGLTEEDLGRRLSIESSEAGLEDADESIRWHIKRAGRSGKGRPAPPQPSHPPLSAGDLV